ncbi:MAG: PAS domain-containing protein [Planctomycetales bacterium]|nr:PAS domain-containing protein [Planctomycetales bacterium]
MPLHRSLFWRLIRIQAVVSLLLIAATVVAGWLVFRPGIGVLLASTSVAVIVVIVAGIVVAYAASRNIEADLGTIGHLVRLVAGGDYSGRIPPDVRDRIGVLAGDLDQMVDHLHERFTDLQAHRDRLRAVLDSMVEGVIAVDEQQRVLLVNDSVCRLFGIDESVALGRPVWEQIRNPQLQEWVDQAMAQPEPVGGELRLLIPLSRVLMIRAVGLNRSRQASAGAVVVVSDMSELRRLEAIRQEFVANASHELKTPLASIKACVETLLDGAADDPEVRTRFLTSANDQADRLDNLIRDLMALTRIESGEIQRELHPIPLDAIVATCLERHRQAAERKQMRLSAEGSPSGMMLLADEESLEEIFDNLLDNAIKYTNDCGNVTVRWRVEEGDGVIEVEDTGIGIPQSHLPRIFERFYRVDRARSRELGGTGLGLSIVKHLVQSLTGRITVASRLGKGTKFTVQLPLADRDLNRIVKRERP